MMTRSMVASRGGLIGRGGTRSGDDDADDDDDDDDECDDGMKF